ncbi:Spy/CpxP family protein refolding chaperone [Candidatus Omnitrophota bacterium]
MSKRLIVMAAVALVTIFTVAVGASLAYERGGEKSEGHYEKSQDLVVMKAHMILKNQDKLGLSDEQIAKVKDLKLQSKKDTIKQDGEIETIALDIKSKMYEDSVDAEAINALIDKKYELKKEKAKSSVAAYIQLKSILTEEQLGQLKELYKECKTEEEKSSR